jgi:predicted acyltransferase
MAFKEVTPAPKEQKPASAATAPTPPKPTTKDYGVAKDAPAKPPIGFIPAALKEPRLVSLDAYRGFIMLMMASAGFGVAKIVKSDEFAGLFEAGSWKHRFWTGLAHQLEHVPWQGGVFWDMIQPAFMFMVGVALPYSYARRAARGDSYASRLLHTLFRSLVLILLAVYLSTSSGAKQTNFIFTNVLAQIGLGYTFLFLFVNKPRWLQLAAIVALCGGWGWAFYQHPLPPADFDYRTVGLTDKQWAEQKADFVPEGDKQHWAYNTNFAAEQDRAILNWFPREKPFEFNEGGYTTLNFVPSLITMLLGLVVGEILRMSLSHGQKLQRLAILAVVCLAAGLAAHYTVMPIVKRIWTPSWALASGAAVIGMLMLFYLVIDVGGWKRLGWPLAVVGMNSIVVYLMSQMLKPSTVRLVKTHLNEPYRRFAEWASSQTGSAWNPELFGGPFGPIYEHLAVLLVFWLVCVWLWKQKLFVRL